jgi:uncharacterized protein (DUF2141 family)
MRPLTLCLALSLGWSAPAIGQQPAREARRPGVATGSVSGIVVTDDPEGKPLRRARVFLNGTEVEIARTTISDDAGRFTFAELPSGRYTIGAAKEGYVTTNFGAGRPGGAGSPVVLRDGGARGDITLRLLRGAVITGTLLDPDGQPIPGVSMRALRYGYTVNGERRLTAVTTTMAGHITDDRGAYRIYGLPPGDYTIAAPAIPQLSTGDEILMMTESEVQRALNEVRPSSRQSPVASETTGVAGGDERRAVGYATVFYPGTPVSSQSVMIPLGSAEERTGIDFQLQYVPMSTIRGSVTWPSNIPPSITVHLIATDDVILSNTNSESRITSVQAKGEFSFANVPPGSYTVIARAPQSSSIYWAMAEVVVDGQTQPDVALSMQPGMTLSGRVAFDSQAAPNYSRIQVSLVPLLSGAQASLATPPARVDNNGRFSISGITAGKYRLQGAIDGSPGWMVRTLAVNGHDVLDTPLDIRQSVDGVVLTFSDRVAELSGTVRDATGRSSVGETMILFPADRTLWTPRSRWIRAEQSSTEGSFQFRVLPAGEYFVAAVSDVDDYAWYDPVLLERLAVTSAVKIAIGEGEKKTLEVIAQSRD